MRRKDREVSDVNEIQNILDACNVCRIGMYDQNEIYILPLNYGYVYENGVLELYFHGAGEGRKIDAVRQNSSVGFEMDCNHELTEGKEACNYSYLYSSIIGNGTIELLETPDDKMKALSILMKHQTGKEFSFPESAMSAVAVLKLTVTKFTCKQHK